MAEYVAIESTQDRYDPDKGFIPDGNNDMYRIVGSHYNPETQTMDICVMTCDVFADKQECIDLMRRRFSHNRIILKYVELKSIIDRKNRQGDNKWIILNN